MVGWLSARLAERRLRGFERAYFALRRWHVLAGAPSLSPADPGDGWLRLAASVAVRCWHRRSVHAAVVHARCALLLLQPSCLAPLHPSATVGAPQARCWPASCCTGRCGGGQSTLPARASGARRCRPAWTLPRAMRVGRRRRRRWGVALGACWGRGAWHWCDLVPTPGHCRGTAWAWHDGMAAQRCSSCAWSSMQLPLRSCLAAGGAARAGRALAAAA